MSSSHSNKKNTTDLLSTAEYKDPLTIPWLRSGVNPNIGADDEDLWGVGGLQIFPSAPSVASLVSTSASDTAAGSGAQIVRVYGLNTSYVKLVEDIPMTGIVPTAGLSSFWRVTRIEVVVAGATGYNEGSITVTVDGNPQALIQIEDNYSHNINYTVPAKYSLIITDFTIMAETGRDILVKTFFRHPFFTNGLWRNQNTYIVPIIVGRSPMPPFTFPAFSDFTVRATKLSGAAGQASALGIGYLTSDPDVGTNGVDVTDTY